MGKKCFRRQAMIRLNIITEGQTEEYFVKNILSPHLSPLSIFPVARNILTSKHKHRYYRGGLISYNKAKNDIISWIKEDNNPDARFSTMFDLYALPTDFPGYEKAIQAGDPYEKVKILEAAFYNDINERRFIPYIQLHEFEALIFSNPKELSIAYFEREKEIMKLEEIANQFNNPELINENPKTAPSKRIIELIPEYDKVNIGPDIAGIIGIEFLKEKCLHFRNWIEKLERLEQ